MKKKNYYIICHLHDTDNVYKKQPVTIKFHLWRSDKSLGNFDS